VDTGDESVKGFVQSEVNKAGKTKSHWGFKLGRTKTDNLKNKAR